MRTFVKKNGQPTAPRALTPDEIAQLPPGEVDRSEEMGPPSGLTGSAIAGQESTTEEEPIVAGGWPAAGH